MYHYSSSQVFIAVKMAPKMKPYKQVRQKYEQNILFIELQFKPLMIWNWKITASVQLNSLWTFIIEKCFDLLSIIKCIIINYGVDCLQCKIIWTICVFSINQHEV